MRALHHQVSSLLRAPAHRTALCLLILLIQHVAIFGLHYAGQAIFLNDSSRNYFPMTAFWLALVKQGVFPEWVPYRNFGFPFVLTMQSGVFYLPLWIFAVPGMVLYNLHLANAVQALHVLGGAVGCWLLLRQQGVTRAVALFGAVAFQFFGGFYSNGEHPDIVRAFAWLPWLCWCVHVAHGQRCLERRNLLVPAIIFLFVCGSYQPNVFSQLFALLLLMLMSFAIVWRLQPQNRQLTTRLYLQLAGLLLLGVAMCSVMLLPVWVMKSYLVRGEVWSGRFMGWSLDYWNALVMPLHSDSMFMLTSMISVFVTVPVFCLLFCVNRSVLSRHWPWLVLTVLAVMMSQGPRSLVYQGVTRLVPVLAYSRFPSSDYRGVMALGLIVLATLALHELLHRKRDRWLRYRAILAVVVLSVASPRGMNIAAPAALMDWLLVIVCAALLCVVLVVRVQRRWVVIAMLLILEFVSGAHFLIRGAMDWHTIEPADAFFPPINQDQQLPVVDKVLHPAQTRPACDETNFFEASWPGFLQGEYLCTTHDAKTRPRERVEQTAALKQLMREPWQAFNLQDSAVDCQPGLLRSNAIPPPQLQQRRYGLQTVDYDVHAAAPFCFVENEMQFTGWQGRISASGETVTPQAYCGALRSWCLPAGDYVFTENYRTPGLRAGAGLSLGFLVIYAVVAWRSRRQASIMLTNSREDNNRSNTEDPERIQGV